MPFGISLALGAAGLASGIFGSSAAKDAAQTQAAASERAAQLTSDTSLKTTQMQLDAQKASQDYQQSVAADQAAKENAALSGATSTAQGGLSSAVGTQQAGLAGAVGTQQGSLGQSISSLQGGLAGATSMLTPYTDLGSGATRSLASLYGIGTANGKPDYSGFSNSPDYNFAYQQGLRGLDQSAASKGMLLSGGQVQSAQEFGQGLASQQYANYFNRLQQLSGIGQSAATTLGGYNLSTGQNIAGEQYGTGQNIAGQQYATGQNIAGRHANVGKLRVKTRAYRSWLKKADGYLMMQSVSHLAHQTQGVLYDVVFLSIIIEFIGANVRSITIGNPMAVNASEAPANIVHLVVPIAPAGRNGDTRSQLRAGDTNYPEVRCCDADAPEIRHASIRECK